MIISHKADSRGYANHGWLMSFHTFSFAEYYNPERVHFGALRVLNDDKVIAGAGFGKHPHKNMEIISIPLKGVITHEDTTGHKENLKPGEVQIMSAGTGLYHSEYNGSKENDLEFLQIWVLPKFQDIQPRYNQKSFDEIERKNKIQIIVSPNHSEALWINQDAYFSICDLEINNKIEYNLFNESNGLYVFLIDGTIEILNHKLKKRDAIGIYQNGISFEITSFEQSKILFIEVPMDTEGNNK